MQCYNLEWRGSREELQEETQSWQYFPTRLTLPFIYLKWYAQQRGALNHIFHKAAEWRLYSSQSTSRPHGWTAADRLRMLIVAECNLKIASTPQWYWVKVGVEHAEGKCWTLPLSDKLESRVKLTMRFLNRHAGKKRGTLNEWMKHWGDEVVSRVS